MAGGAALVLLSILFWSIFYQNLPENFGLNPEGSHSAAHSPSDLDVGAADTPAAKTADALDASSANTLDRAIKIFMIAMSAYVIATRWALTRSVAKNINLGAAAFLVLALLSALWSRDPTVTLLRFITLMAVVLVCFAISLAGWDRRRFQQLAIPPLMFILVVSLLLGVVYPDRVSELGTGLSLQGAWHGIAITKNLFGMIASLAAIICVNRWLAGEGRTSWAIAGSAAAGACLLLSRSNASQFATLAGVFSMVLVMRVPVIKHRYSGRVIVAIAAVIVLYELAIQDLIPGVNTLLSPIMHLTGKDMTFSARTTIWQIVKEHAQGAPYLGTGYGAYWLGAYPSSPSYIFVQKMFFYPTEAHNGYLEIKNDLGDAGLVCLFLFLIEFIRQALQLMRTDRSQAALYLALLFQEMVINMSESDFFSRSSTFAILALACTCMSRELREARLQPRGP